MLSSLSPFYAVQVFSPQAGAAHIKNGSSLQPLVNSRGSEPCSLPGQHNGVDPSDRGLGELAPGMGVWETWLHPSPAISDMSGRGEMPLTPCGRTAAPEVMRAAELASPTVTVGRGNPAPHLGNTVDLTQLAGALVSLP